MTPPAAGEPGAVRLVKPETRARIETDLAERLRVLESAVKRVRQDADADAVHDLRVASRRLTAALDLWAPCLDPRGLRRARRRVRRLRRDWRVVRDLEVARDGILARLPKAEPASRFALEALLAGLARRHRRVGGKARHRLDGDRIERIRRALERALVRRVQPAPDDETPASLARAHVESRRGMAMAAMATAAGHPGTTALHEARVAIKRWRYAVECARPLLAGPAEGAPGETAPGVPLRALRQAQEMLGRVQDLVVLGAFVGARSARATKRGRREEAEVLMHLLATIAAEQREAMEACYRLATTLSTGG